MHLEGDRVFCDVSLSLSCCIRPSQSVLLQFLWKSPSMDPPFNIFSALVRFLERYPSTPLTLGLTWLIVSWELMPLWLVQMTLTPTNSCLTLHFHPEQRPVIREFILPLLAAGRGGGGRRGPRIALWRQSARCSCNQSLILTSGAYNGDALSFLLYRWRNSVVEF